MNIFNFNINPVHTNVNWNTLITVISTLLSVLFGYFLKSIKESKSNKREVLAYAYDLNILLKRLMLIYSDIDKKLKAFENNDKGQRTLLFYNPILLEPNKLQFIINTNPRLYEELLQQDIELNIIWSEIAEYNDGCRIGIKDREILLYRLWYQLIKVMAKIHINILSLDIYYKKTYKTKTFINGYLVNIVKEATDFMVDIVKMYKDGSTKKSQEDMEYIIFDCIVSDYDSWVGNYGLKNKEYLGYIDNLIKAILEIKKTEKESAKQNVQTYERQWNRMDW